MFVRRWYCILLLLPALVWAGDPMRPPNLEAPAQEFAHEPLRLSMILSEQGRKRAIVNGKVLAVTERIGTARLLAIQDDHVVMVRGGQQFTLRLPIPAIKQVSEGDVNE